MIVQADIQLSPDSLLPSQQFTLGGGSSVRGYRENIRSADNGFRFSVENRFTLRQDENFEPVLQLAPFVDVGAVWNHPDNPNILPEETFLGSIGLGILWQPFPALDLGLYYAEPFVDVGDRTNNLQDEGFHFRVNYRL
ncbi:MAG: ShlB/FhaC/HecB family hemolysin secretion/activation protein [Leptolyngbyaceae cyanobacterium SL_5_9]|nr:ShlB/FhaC/HecB family hemolysin secretion/activation protein [Leptolyngbyaceae cyanobacterium SL_5_9]